MARSQAKLNIKNSRRQLLKHQGKRPQGIKKPQALLAIEQSHKQSLSESNHIKEVQVPLSPPVSNTPEGRKASQDKLRKRKRGQDAEHRSPSTQEKSTSKRLQTKPLSCTAEKGSYPTTNISEESSDPLEYWIQNGKWRKEYFEQDSQVKEDFERGKFPEDPRQRDWLQELYTREAFRSMQALTHLHQYLARKKPVSRNKSQSSLQTPSDQPSREPRNSQYNNIEYVIRLEQKGSYMRDYVAIDDDNKGENMKKLCQTLLEGDQTLPEDSLFRDDLFRRTCEKIQNRNEAIVIQDITRLIVPSAENLSIYGAKHLDHLFESVNESWSSMAVYEGTLPQPDYSVGFARSAFTREQLNKLNPFVGEPGYKLITYFMATTRIYFPFLTCEVKCGAAALDIADRQNAQSMSIALRALVVLFRLVKREKELDREILVFSISHDDRSVRIYGHYPVIEGNEATFWRRSIHEFSFTARAGEEKWTAYKFTKNVYDHHSPKLHRLICSGIHDLPPGINYDLSQSPSFSQSTPQDGQRFDVDSMLGGDDSQSNFFAPQSTTPTTSLTHANEPAFKKPKNQRGGGQGR